MRSPFSWLACFVLALLVLVPACGDGEEEESGQTPYGTTPYGTTPYGTTPYAAGAAGIDAELKTAVEAALAKGKELLLSAQEENGSFGDPETGVPPNVGFTAMAVAAIVGATPATAVADDAAIAKGLAWLAAQQKEDGAIFSDPAFRNYMTSASIGAFSAAKIPAYRNVQGKAREFIAGSQIVGDESGASYGGFPYKDGQAADLSNVQFALTALADAGLPKDHPVWERTLVYLSRVQNRSESNTFVATAKIDDQEVKVVSGDDGGAVYYPGNSKVGLVKRSDGTYEATSYGSMTYALLKCLLLAGADPKDPRVVAALGWISHNFTLERNPGFESAAEAEKAGQQGWYYYAFTLARTLAEYERLTKAPLEVKDRRGNSHNWRPELARAILERQRDDGWWVNESAVRWDEGAPVLATGYVMQALAELSGRYR